MRAQLAQSVMLDPKEIGDAWRDVLRAELADFGEKFRKALFQDIEGHVHMLLQNLSSGADSHHQQCTLRGIAEQKPDIFERVLEAKPLDDWDVATVRHQLDPNDDCYYFCCSTAVSRPAAIVSAQRPITANGADQRYDSQGSKRFSNEASKASRQNKVSKDRDARSASFDIDKAKNGHHGVDKKAVDSPSVTPRSVRSADSDKMRAVKSVKQDKKIRRLQSGTFGGVKNPKKVLEDEMRSFDVTKFYHTEGTAQSIARSERFQNCTLGLIIVNACYLGIDSEFNDADALSDATWQYQLCENAFCALFLAEILLRLAAFRYKTDCVKDRWFLFDGSLVSLMVLETWCLPLFFVMAGMGGEGGANLPIGPLRLLRLTRLSRLVRLMRSMPELVTMLRGLKVASRAVCSCLLMVDLWHIHGRDQLTSTAPSGSAAFDCVIGSLHLSFLHSGILTHCSQYAHRSPLRSSEYGGQE
eukprot:gnl/TRDRNA2_/TRDRNA2_164449_c1_seq1.p1 gnl/TRDRNA2_/TRDRNA2_164449_c1~~gnl/TRDRNA2_/TRDRNA2_164449_c1_seq1.p1  ORF type:complete len:471 (-),score=52.23 gnl/TRDRNA2_/TRDRNA2_164449_c1_seq1:637-2049(-)